MNVHSGPSFIAGQIAPDPVYLAEADFQFTETR